jgi:two-component system sensor histidine kinase ChiS
MVLSAWQPNCGGARIRKTIRRCPMIHRKNASLERLDMAKDRFLAITSHELRTPLHGMIGLSESMLAGSAGDLSQEARENLSLMVSSGHRLADMVSDLLDMASIQEGDLALNIRGVDLSRLGDSVIKLTLPLLGERPVEIRNDISRDISPVRADEDRIRQVLHNLLGNAVRCTPRQLVLSPVRRKQPRVMKKG